MSDLTPPVVTSTRNPAAWNWLPSWLDFSGIIAGQMPQPGPVLQPHKGQPVPAPGNPESLQPGGVAGQVRDAIRSFIPTPEQKRDYLAYGAAGLLIILAVWAALK